RGGMPFGAIGDHVRRAFAIAALIALAGCGEHVIEARPSQRPELLPLQSRSVDKIDLLLVIDNSRSMGEKQDILRLAIPDLVRQLTNPLCVDAAGNPAAQQPDGPLAACPSGFH